MMIKNLSLEEIRELRNKCYNIAIQEIKRRKLGDDTKKEIDLLLNQFNYGLDAKNDLLCKCIELGWVNIKQLKQ